MDFLNQVLPSDYTIKELHFSKNEHLGTASEDRKAIFDIYCTSSKQERFVVELQKARQDFFKDRSVYYASFPIQEMAKPGNWNYELQPVFTVGILNFKFKDHLEEADKIRHHVQLKDQDCQVFYDKLHFIYLELPKFTKSLQECQNHYERWLWVFKNLPDLEEMPTDLQESIFVKLFQITEVARFKQKEREAYEESLKYLRDLQNVVDTAFKEGEEKGMEKGMEKGTNFHACLSLLNLMAEAPNMSVEQMAAICSINKDRIYELKSLVAHNNQTTSLNYILKNLLRGIDLSEPELNTLSDKLAKIMQQF